jgi:hypothetical protein
MKHFHRTQLPPVAVLEQADAFFRGLDLDRTLNAQRARTYVGPLGELHLSVHKEAGHYTFVSVDTDQMGESRLDRNAKRFFVELRRTMEPRHALKAAY